MAPTRSILLLTADRVGPAMAGPAIRTVEFARVLAGDGHRVTVAAPWVDGTPADVGLDGTGVDLVAAWDDDLRPLAAASAVVVAMTGVLEQLSWLADLRAAGVAVVADAYDPVLFEVLVGFADTSEPRRSAVTAGAAASMCAPLRWADVVLCATSSQRHLLLGILAAWGRLGPAAYAADPRLAASVAEVPFGLPTDPPSPGNARPLRGPDGPFNAGDTVVLWGGGLWDWLDPLTLIEAVAASGDASIKAFFMAGPHPSPSVPDMAMVRRARDLAAQRGLCAPDGTPTPDGPAVAFADQWIAHADRAGYLCDATAGAILAPDHVEATFAYRTRVLDYLWAGLPVLCSAGDDLATRVAAEGLGLVVPPGDVEACSAALHRLGDRDWYDSTVQRVALAASTMTWPTVTGPLRDFCREPRTTLSAPPTIVSPTPPPSGPVAGVRRRVAGVVHGLRARGRR